MKSFRADLHIHTGLSPCASDEMTPPAIVQAAVDRGLSMIAICDHNSAGNVAATQAAGRGRLAVLAGIEITTAEEVHVVGLFPDAQAVRPVSLRVRATLPDSTAASRKFGEQRLLDSDGRVVGHERKMLSGASSLGLSETVALIKENGGLAVAAHVDRPSFSVLSQLGVFPTDAGFDAVEVFTAAGVVPKGSGKDKAAVKSRDNAWGLPVLASSDSHFLTDISRVWTVFRMCDTTFEEMTLALRGVGGREVRCA